MIPIRMAVMAATVLPVLAIEPPVDSAPIPPQEPAKPVPAPADRVAPAPAPVEMPEAVADRPYIGVILDPIPDLLTGHLRLEPGEGVMISELVAGGPAEAAGLEVNDLLIDVNGEKVGSRDEVRGMVEKHEIGEEVELGIIHDGERKKVTVKLGAAPQAMPGFQAPAPGVAGGEQLDGFLEGIPEKHADAIRKALEQNMKQFDGLEMDPAQPDGGMRQMMQRMQRQMGGMQLKLDGFDAESTIRLLDDEGSIEMKQSNGNKEARVFGKDGKLLWEGPYDTEADKAAVPDDIRERIERLNFDIGGEGMKLRIDPGRFRPLDEIEPEDEPAEKD
ncbi:S1C family serine protease [Haloferula rosea]|uniref:PDZ domain-containing protein n=1 Tax=Haloferula rosea TaxID=490093 RepID=A0A934RB21_9BACT|nr:PDZ domain-containing protein [Haloferula rosea]MBK1826059.1 PDZ domain-containing protein [Haloferula rosea]